MRILMTADTVGGVWTYAMNLGAGLLQNGVDLRILSFGDGPSSAQCAEVQKLLLRYPSQFTFAHAEFPLEWMPGEQYIEESKAFVEEQVKAFQPDVLHTNQFCYGSITCDAPVMLVAHSDVVSWWVNCKNQNPPEDAWFAKYKAVVRSGLAAADLVVVPSSWQMTLLKEHFPGISYPCSIIPNGSKSQFGDTQPKLQAVAAGRFWDQAKNLRMLEQIDTELPILIAGSGKSEPNTFDPPSNGRTIQFEGWLDHDRICRLFMESAVFVSPSLYEPFGLAALEAAHASCALALSDIPSYREIWNDDAIYFSPHNPAELCNVIRRLKSDQELRNDLGRRAQTRARSHYGLDAFTGSYLREYRQLMEVQDKE